MKIYKEIVIDMNPESNSYNKIISEDSFEYNGELALLGGGWTDKWNRITGREPGYRIQAKTGSPGVSAMARGFASTGRTSEKFKHPSAFPSYWAEAPAGFGIDEPVTLGESALPDIGTVDPGDFKQKIESAHGPFGLFGRKHPRAAAVMERAEDYDTAFKEQWYPDYLQKGITGPATQLTAYAGTTPGQGAFMPLQEAVAELGGDYPATFPDISEIAPEAVPPGESGYGEGPIILKESMGQLGDIADELGLAGEEYWAEEERLEGTKEDIMEAKELGLEKAALGRKEGTSPAAYAKMDPIEARIGKTGMAYSAPAERLREMQGQTFAKQMGDITRSERDIRRDFRSNLETWDLEKEAQTSAWEEAKTGFGGGLQDLATTAEGSLKGILDYIKTALPESHSQFGQQIGGTGVGSYGDASYGGYDWENVERGHLMGEGESVYGAPTGGWFAESTSGAGLPGLGPARDIARSAEAWSQFLKQTPKSSIASWLPQTPPGSTGG